MLSIRASVASRNARHSRGPIEHDMSEVRRPSRMDARARPAPRLFYVLPEICYFLSHRLPMARAARAAGFEVHVATNVGEDAADIREEGFILHPVRFARGRLSPLRTVRTILALRRLYRTINPAIVHYVSMQPTLLGVLASFGSKFAVVYAITGLGYAFVADSSKTRSLRRGFRALLLLGLNVGL